MQRIFFLSVGVLACSLVAACSDNPTDIARHDASRLNVIASTQTLDQSIRTLLELFPKKRSKKGDDSDADSDGDGGSPNLNPRTTWDRVVEDYAKGETKPKKIENAKKRLFKLSDWVTRNSQLMNDPPDDETKTAAAARLVLYMSLYVYGGPETPPPPYAPGADAVVGVVTPDAPATIVTPTLRAGVQFEAGSVAENTVIVVTQNPIHFPDACSGPLQTKLCQYPLFYTFEQFPEKALLKAAKVNVCHVNSGEGRLPLADHERFRLAHTKPANPADYTPGSTIRDQNGENVEILPLVEQTFSHCEETTYGMGAAGPRGVFSRFARGMRNLVTPRTAYAVDKGLGGLVKYFSPFNILDKESAPDLKVESMSFDPAGAAHPGDHVVVTYTIFNDGTTTATTIPTTVRLSNDAGLTVADLSFASIAVPALLPRARFSGSQEFVIPDTTVTGLYHLGLMIADDPTNQDANLLDNQAATPTVIALSFISLFNGLAVGQMSVCALASGNVTYCWGGNDPGRELGTPTPVPAFSAVPILPTLPAFARLSVGNGEHTCGITSSGSATCWGRNTFGALGGGANFNSPVTVAGGITWSRISMSRLSACGVSTTNVGYCWGSNQWGEIGSASIPRGAGSATGTPNVVDGGHSWKVIVAGWLHACGITTAGTTYCWGNNEAGQLGIGIADDTQPYLVPTPVATTERFIQLSLGTRSTCGITVKHEAFCWGENGMGQLGDGFAGPTSLKTIPTRVAGGHRFSFIAVGSGFEFGATVPRPPVEVVGAQGNTAHTCALTETGRPYCWGWNGDGQLGDGTTTDRLVPTPVAGSLRFTSIGLGGAATCGTNGARIWCWGSNLRGQLGNGTLVNSATPVPVAPPFS